MGTLELRHRALYISRILLTHCARSLCRARAVQSTSSAKSCPAMSYVCQCCGQRFDGLPLDFVGEAPWRNMGVSDDEFDARVLLEKSLCVVDGVSFFVRG